MDALNAKRLTIHFIHLELLITHFIMYKTLFISKKEEIFPISKLVFQIELDFIFWCEQNYSE